MNVGVIGVGAMGAIHARIYKNLKGINLVGVCDIDRQQVEKISKIFNVKSYTDYTQMIRENKIDALSIAVPTKYHYQVALDCIKAKIPILLEKPIAATVTEAKEIIQAAKQQRVLVLVGHIERYNPAVIELQKQLETGKFGEILSIVVKRIGLYPPRIQDTNVITDLAVHDLDIINTLLGIPPISIIATGGKAFNTSIEDHAEIFLEYPSFGCFVQVNWITPIKVRTLAVSCSKGYIELNYITQKLTIYKNNNLLTPPREFNEFVAKLGEPPKEIIHIKKKEPLLMEIKNFLAAVKKQESPRVTTADALHALHMTSLVQKSMQEKKAIKYDI